MNKKILPICEEQPLTANVDYTHILSIALNNPKAYEWLAENYIQMIVNKDNLDSEPIFYNFINYSNLYNTEYYFVANNKVCPFLDIYRQDYKEYLEYKLSIIDYLKNKIDKNYYVFLFLDITKISAYHLIIQYHCPLLFGYDDEQKIFYFRDYCDLHYKTHTASYAEIEDSFNSFISQDVKYKSFLAYGINCIKLTDCDYEFNVQRLKLVLSDYLEGDNVKKSYMKFINNEDYHYGISVIKSTITALKKCLEINSYEIGSRVRYSHFFDHKVAMKIRLEILKEKGVISKEDYEKFYRVNMEAINIAKKILNLYLMSWIRKDNEIIIKMIRLLVLYKEMEEKNITELLNVL